MQIKGKIKEIKEVRQITENFKTQNFVLDLTRYNPDTGEEYENYAEFQVNNEKCDLSNLKVEDRVTVDFNVQGRYFEKKDGSGIAFAQNLIAYKITK